MASGVVRPGSSASMVTRIRRGVSAIGASTAAGSATFFSLGTSRSSAASDRPFANHLAGVAWRFFSDGHPGPTGETRTDLEIRIVARFGPVDMRAQAEVLSARRSDTPRQASPQLARVTGTPEIGLLRRSIQRTGTGLTLGGPLPTAL